MQYDSWLPEQQTPMEPSPEGQTTRCEPTRGLHGVKAVIIPDYSPHPSLTNTKVHFLCRWQEKMS